MAVSRRDYRVALGVAQGRRGSPTEDLQVFWLESRMLRHSREHSRTNLLSVVKREGNVRSTFISEGSMRPTLTDDPPSDAQQGCQHGACPRRTPFRHPGPYAAKDTLLTE